MKEMVEYMAQNHVFHRIINGMIRIMLAGALFLLLLHSVFSTSFVGTLVLEDGSWQERTLNIADNPLRHLLLFVVFSTILFLVRKVWRRVHVRVTANIFWIFTVITLAAGTAYVLMTQLYPGSDPAKVYAIAMQWRQGDFSAFQEEGYLFCYPFQSGIVLFLYLLSFLFGEGNYVGPQLVNVICLAVIYGLLAKLFPLSGDVEEVGGGKEHGLQTAVYLSLFAWTPLAFYVTYLYGILPGMALSLGAVCFALRYLCTRQYRYITAASLCMGLATVIKMNCLIYLIAIACFLVYDAIDLLFLSKGEHRRKWMASLLFIACMGLSVVVCGKVNDRLVERITGQELGEGEVMLSWIVMGLQEAPLGPGGYNGYISNVFTANHYDTEQVTEASLEDLRTIMTRMSENPLDEGLPFFARKTAFQWNDPTFICLDRTRGRKGAVTMPVWLKSLIYGRGSVYLSILLNYMQTLILLCALLYILFRWRSRNLYELMGAVVFLGGFLFHMFWESSASYTIPYFILLIPYAVCGMAEWMRYLETVIEGIGKKENMAVEEQGNGKKKAILCGAALAFVLLLTAFTRTNLFDRTIALNDDLQGIDVSDQFYKRGDWEIGY